MHRVKETTTVSTDSTNRGRKSRFSVRPSSHPPGTGQDVIEELIQVALSHAGSPFKIPYTPTALPVPCPRPVFTRACSDAHGRDRPCLSRQPFPTKLSALALRRPRE